MVEGLEKLALELGVKIYTNRPIAKIISNGNQVAGVEFVNGEVHLSSLVVSNVDVPTTNNKLLPENHKPQSTTYKMTPGVITYYWGIKGKVNHLGHHTIFLPNDYKGAFNDLFKKKRIPEQLPFYVSVPSETDASLAPTGDTSMFVLVPTPLLSELPNVNWSQTIQSVKEQVLARLQSHGVELTSNQIISEEIYTPEDWSKKFGLYDGSAFGGAHTLFQVGPFRPRNYSSELQGLFYTGASTTPGTGMPMVILSGKLTAARVLEKTLVH